MLFIISNQMLCSKKHVFPAEFINVVFLQIKNNVKKHYEKVKEEIALELKSALQYSKIGIAIDLWQDNVTHVHHLGCTAHYFVRNEDTDILQLVSRVLRLWPFDAELPKDADRVNEAMNEVLVEYDLLQHKGELIFMTDRGLNVINSLDGFSRFSCLIHFINNVTKAVCTYQPVSELQTRVTRLVKYLKSSGRSSAVEGSLKSYVSTRWNSFYQAADCFINVYDQIGDIIPISNTAMIQMFIAIRLDQLIAVRDFLRPFYLITKELEYDTEITRTKILPAFESISMHILPLVGDCALVKEMKRRASAYFDKHQANIFPSDMSFWAFFDPKYKLMNSFKTINRDTVMNSLTLRIEQMFGEDDENNNPAENSQMDNSIFAQFVDGSHTGDGSFISNLSEEIAYYLKMPFEKNGCIIKFWSKQREQLPRLYKYFLHFAAVPASSASVERMFSDCGNIVTVKRNRLSSDVLNSLAFLHKNT